MNISGWVTFRELVDDVMLAWGDSSDHGQFMRYLNFAIKGYGELRLRQLSATQPVALAISSESRAVVMPNDFLKFVSVGVMSDGKFYKFRPKSDVVASVAADCGVDTRNVPDGLMDAGDEITRYFPAYTLDLENRRILIDGPLNLTEVILNYTPTGISMDGITYIPRMCVPAITTYMEHQIVLRDKRFSYTDRILFEKEYVKALVLFRGLQYNVEEIFEEYYMHIALNKQY